MGAPVIKAIPREYAGTRFASTLEADWAANLDRLKIRWAYEPEGLVLPSGQWYRCDMWLPRIATWLEIKGGHNQRIDKPGDLQSAVLHAPGCSVAGMQAPRPRSGNAPATQRCSSCGHGPAFPFQLVVVGRAAERGGMVFEGAPCAEHPGPQIVLVKCGTCVQFSFADLSASPWMCRRCHSSGSVKVYQAGKVSFRQLEHRPASRSAGQKKPARRTAGARR